MKSKTIEREHLFVCEYCHKVNDITNPVEEARADEREKIKKLMHYSEHYKEKVLFEDNLKEGDEQ